MRGDLRKYWGDPGYWRWLWRERVSGESKVAIIAMVATALGLAGFLGGKGLAQTQEGATFAAKRVVTVVRKTRSSAPTQVVTKSQTTTQSGETAVLTVRRDGRRILVRAPGETVTEALTVRGPVQERVVTDERTDTVVHTQTADQPTTVTTPGTTVTTPGTTVTTPGTTGTVTREVTQPAATVTETSTVTSTQEVTITEEVTVTVTETDKKPKR